MQRNKKDDELFRKLLEKEKRTKENMRAYYLANRERLKEYSRNYYKNHVEERKEYYRKNSKKIIAAVSRYYQKKKSKMLEVKNIPIGPEGINSRSIEIGEKDAIQK